MRMAYYLPWWPSDYVRREWTSNHDMSPIPPNWTRSYFWDYLPGLLDGILVSRMALSPKRVEGLRKEIRYDGTIMGDSGAHSYSSMENPPYGCEELLEYYERGQFNYGMTLDMVASPWVRPGGVPEQELERRMRVTIENAEACKEIHAQRHFSFELIGVVQGWDVESYTLCARKLIQLGFSYLAIAGQKKIALIHDAILGVIREIRDSSQSIRLHVLGTGNPRLLSFYKENSISSCDSTTWLRKAWLSEKHNYFLVDQKAYKAYRATRVGLGDIDRAKLTWETEVSCLCPFCRELGQDILLFRGHERNTRRGFHNICQYIRLINSLYNVTNGEEIDG